MENLYLFLNLSTKQAVDHIVAQEKPEVGIHYFNLACAPDESKNQLFNIELIIDKDGTWKYNPFPYDEKRYSVIAITTINNDGEYSLDYEVTSKRTFKIMKENETEHFQVEDALANW